jgi:hypothetical protein
MMSDNKHFILDKVQFYELLARLRMKNCQRMKATDQLDLLLQLNTVNYETYYKILEARGIPLFDEFGNKNKLDEGQKKIVKDTLEKYR